MNLIGAGLVGSVLAIAATPALALDLDLPGEVNRIDAAYKCADGVDLGVEFINVGENSLAVIRIDDGDPLVFANVVAASGARYVAGVYEFWEAKGEATFTKAGSEGVTCKPD